MLRACKLTLKFITNKKRRAIEALLQSYRSAVNFYIRSLWVSRGKLDKKTLARLPDSETRLSSRYKSQALKQAIETVVATKKSAKALGKPCSMPVFRGSAVLDSKFVSVEEGRGSFDLAVRLSCLSKGNKLTIPTRRTSVLNKWCSEPLAKISQGCAISEKKLIVWVELPDLPNKTKGEDLGIDIGVNKLISLSDGTHLGKEFKQLRNKINRKVSGSKSKRRSLRERDQFIRRTVNLLPWNSIKTIAVENLKDLKLGKKKGRNKKFRKAMAPWCYRQVITAVQQKAQQYRVRVELVPPAFTSLLCPHCGTVSKSNRKAEDFECINCSYHNDADTVGAINVLDKALGLVGSLESPMLKTSLIGMTI